MTWEELVKTWVLSDERIDDDAPQLAADLIMAYSAQGVIDNGGFRYFFENNFPGKTHNEVAEAFRRIGLISHADLIKQLCSVFQNGKLADDLEIRGEFLEERFEYGRDDKRNLDVQQADTFFWDNSESVYKQLDDLCSTL